MTVTRVFPLGHPVEIESDNVAALAGLWQDQSALFDVAPLRFSVEVFTGGGCGPVTFKADSKGFRLGCDGGTGVFDLSTQRGALRGNNGSLVPLLEPLVLTALDWTFFTPIHAGCVRRDGKSVLLCGDSGAGKSTLVYACSGSGWEYVSDNALHWAGEPHNMLVSGSPEIRLREGALRLFSLPGPPERLTGERCAPAGPFVFLRRRPGPAEIRPQAPDAVVRYLAHYDTCPARVHPDPNLLSHGAWVMEYDDVWDGVRCLESLL